MNLLIQETNTSMKFLPPVNMPRRRYERITYEQTVGGHFFERFMPVLPGSDVFNKAWDLVYSLDDNRLAEDVKRFLHILQDMIIRTLPTQLEFGAIPELGAHYVEDGSVLLEWIFQNYRIGFSIEPNPYESSWFLVTDAYLGSIGASGLLQRAELSALLHWLLNFIGNHV